MNDHAKENQKMVLIDGGKMLLLKSVPVMEPIKVDDVKTEKNDVEIMPVVTTVMSEAPKMNDDSSVAPVVEKDSLRTIDAPNKDATSTDSEVASSYYRSKYYRYYVGY